MFSSKFISSSIRCLSSLTSSQIPLNQGVTAAAFQNTQFDNRPVRQFSVSPTLLSSTNVALPPKPKRPANPFAIFVKEKRGTFINMAPTASAPEIISMLGKEWKHMDKSKYEEEFRRRRDEYSEEIERYNNSLSEEQRDLLKQEVSVAKQLKARRELLSTRPPKYPRSANNLYISQRVSDSDMQEIKRHEGISEMFKRVNAEYRNLPFEEKQKFKSMAEDDRERYRLEFVEWYKRVQQRDDLRLITRRAIKDMAARYNRMFFKNSDASNKDLNESS